MGKFFCFKCGHVPCICGEQYKTLDTVSLLTLINNLQYIVNNRDVKLICTIDNKTITQTILNVEKQIPLFTSKLIKKDVDIIFPIWKTFLMGQIKVEDTYNNLGRFDADEFPLPNLLKLIIVIRIISLLPTNSTIKFIELYKLVLKTLLQPTNDPVWKAFNALPSDFQKQTYAMKNYQFVDLCKQAGTLAGALANMIYTTWLHEYDDKGTFESRVYSLCTFVGIYAGVPEYDSILSPQLLCAKYRDQLYYLNDLLDNVFKALPTIDFTPFVVYEK